MHTKAKTKVRVTREEEDREIETILKRTQRIPMKIERFLALAQRKTARCRRPAVWSGSGWWMN
jgi:hypothetical protein